MDFPALEALPQLRDALRGSGLALLQAPPGAGKSTVLPLELLHEPWLAGRRVVMLQPRRVAARAVAARMAELLGETVGETVGYRVRFESRSSARTRLEVVTEGILTRQLQRDPELAGVGLVIFDEFHERSLQADLAYTLCREVQGALRDDLRLLVMSATLSADLPARLGADLPVIRAEGRPHPVELRYLEADPQGPIAPTVARAVAQALERHPGDVLAFLPGVGEIRAVARLLEERHPEVRICPLYGDLPLDEQRRALLPDPQGRRRVVLATSIAETSLTLEGVRVVVDSGYARHAVFDPRSALTRLVTGRVTADSAAQRAGRAGRTAPGVAYRLWSERTQALLPPARPPEILEADLAPLTLELAQWGVRDAAELAWPDPPPARALEAARDLLLRLEAIDADGRITGRGARMLELPTHPRLAHLLLEGQAMGLAALACDVAALLEERDPLEREAGADLTRRVEALRAWRRAGARGEGVLARIERLSRQWRAQLRVGPEDAAPRPQDVGALIALAYPERVARRREQDRHRYRLAGGRGVRLEESDPLSGSDWLAVAQLDAGAEEGRVYLAAELDPTALEAHARDLEVVRWDARAGTLVAQRERRFGELIISTRPLNEVPPAQRLTALLEALRTEGLGLLNWTPQARQWQARVLSLRSWRPDEAWPDVSDSGLLASLEDWLGPQLGAVRRREDFARIDLEAALSALLPWPLPRQLDELAPARLTVPSGSAVRLEYAPDGSAPVLAVKLQELFGLADTPAVNGGRTPVLLHLLSPAGRPVQVTQDLRGFWERGYFEARKELRGRYPRHPWPDDPWTAEPTRRAKPRGT
ncbi:ATP-dependent helicase HrpB [Deinobacterium chartae]|uniref:ATP-dependent helicase HrpB n=1 Tax=Deinobacterium chartae TaxID=521158 RepID=A0A841I054_9DEIO|nr:ATP-dependent helicase HrpB [Deinobacterium chartae]MBB6099027.1 ATP-dependent helicase HrpB [Deinobacterium chartae]